jgi:hypothetical protein
MVEGDVGLGAGDQLPPADNQGPVLEPHRHLRRGRGHGGAQVLVGGYRPASLSPAAQLRHRGREEEAVHDGCVPSQRVEDGASTTASCPLLLNSSPALSLASSREKVSADARPLAGAESGGASLSSAPGAG